MAGTTTPAHPKTLKSSAINKIRSAKNIINFAN
jgi:hypothetical protein